MGIKDVGSCRRKPQYHSIPPSRMAQLGARSPRSARRMHPPASAAHHRGPFDRMPTPKPVEQMALAGLQPAQASIEVPLSVKA